MDKKVFEPQWTDCHIKAYQEFFDKQKQGKETYELFHTGTLFFNYLDDYNIEPIYKTIDEYGNKELHYCEEPTWP